MKTQSDPRHKRRIDTVTRLFSMTFDHTTPDSTIASIVKDIPAIDEKIVESAPDWPIDKIAKIDLAILRLAIFELLIERKEPPKVIIDEAVEIAKEYGNDKSSSFINGVLGTVLKTIV